MHNTYKNVKMDRITFERIKFDWLWLVMIFLFSLNFLAKPNYLLMGVSIIGTAVALYKTSTFKMTIDLLLIWLFSLSYFILLTYHGRGSIGAMLTYMIGPVLSFLIGYSIVNFKNEFIFKTIMAIVLGNFIHGFLNMTSYFRLYGFTSSIIGSRVLPDIWTGKVLSATLQGTYYTLISSLLFYSLILLINKKRKELALVILLSTVFSLLATFIMGNRTLIAIIFITFLSNFILYSALTRKKPRYIIKIIFFIAIFVLAIYLFYTNNIFSIRKFVEGSTWYMRSNTMVVNEDPRIQVYQRAMLQMFEFPFGGYRMDLGLSYAHNLWLDVLYATGLIPFFFLIVCTFKLIKNLVQLLKQKNTDIEFKIFIFSVYTGFLLNFMVEPILEGVPYMFLSFCLVNGMIRKQIDLYKKYNYL